MIVNAYKTELRHISKNIIFMLKRDQALRLLNLTYLSDPKNDPNAKIKIEAEHLFTGEKLEATMFYREIVDIP